MLRIALRRGLLALCILLPGTFVSAAEIVLDQDRRAALVGLPSLMGPALSDEDLEGQVVVVAFWASWCPPCHPEFDHLNEAAELHESDDVTIVAVNIFEEFGAFKGTARRDAFLAKKAPHFAVLADGEGVAPLFGKVSRIPTLFVFRRDGRPELHFVHEQGAEKTHVTGDELKAALRAALDG